MKDSTAKNVSGELIRGTTSLNNVMGILNNKTNPMTNDVVFKAFFCFKSFALAD